MVVPMTQRPQSSRHMPETIPELLTSEMRRRETDQTGLARVIGVPPSRVNRWLSGTVPSPASCDVIADTLGYDVDQVLIMAGHRPDADGRPQRASVAKLHALARRMDDGDVDELIMLAEMKIKRYRS